tara:strand:+ start:810 stop:986 length:177 start_codon:yes stop_codon:yes gene_type:complete
MADMKTIIIYEGSKGITDNVDKAIVDYDDNTQKIFESSTDRSAEATKVKAILDAFFGD